VECGGAPIGAEDDIENWRWTVSRAMKSDYSWINGQLMSISSIKWTDQKPQVNTVS
jgi:hypothetical protein